MTDRGRALVSCPTFAGKEYAVEAWKAGYDALTYEPRHAYMVDNTRVSQAYFRRLQDLGIPCDHLQPWPDWDRTFRRCWEMILERAEALDCYWVFSVEADNVPAPESLQRMVDLALAANVHLVSHAYPMHATAARASGVPEDSFYYNELGCMLMTTSLLRRTMAEFDEYGQMVVAIEATNQRYMGGRIVLSQLFEVKHLDGYEMSFANLGPSEYPGLMYPVDKMPADIGTVLPPSLQEELAG
jgi:hypothetical protein